MCSNKCNLNNSTTEKLIKHGEEPGEVGGYFVLNGIERIIRLLIQQRRHYIMGMIRGAYARRGPMYTGPPRRTPPLFSLGVLTPDTVGPTFSPAKTLTLPLPLTLPDYATAIRCVSEDETSMTVRLHYLSSGSARVAFVIRRQEFFIPARARLSLLARARGAHPSRSHLPRAFRGANRSCCASRACMPSTAVSSQFYSNRIPLRRRLWCSKP